MNVLLVEPDYLLGVTYQKALQNKGHNVQWCRDAQNAIHGADASLPDVVLLELQLPGHSGIEFLYEFRSYPEWQHIPVVLHTFVPEQSLEASRQHFASLGVVRYLYKPMTNLQQLARTVNEALFVSV